MTGVDGYATRCNPALQRLLGRTIGDIAVTDVISMVHPDHRTTAVSGWRALCGEIDGFTQETRMMRGDGSTVWLHESTVCVRDELGNPLHFMSQYIDIDDRKQAEAERDRALAELTSAHEDLRQSEAKFKFLVHGTPVPLIEVGEDLRIVSANAALTERLGRDPIGLSITDVIHDRELPSSPRRSRPSWERPIWCSSSGSSEPTAPTRWVRAHSRVRRREDGAFLSATATWTDITEVRLETDDFVGRLRRTT